MSSKEYQRYIVSDDKHATLLHRCRRELLPKLASNGHLCGHDPQSSFTWQPRDLEGAEN